MRHKTIHDKALLLDSIVDYYMKGRHRIYFPHKQLRRVLPMLFPEIKPEGRGVFKTVYRITSRNSTRDLVLKAGSASSTRRDWSVYNSLPKGIRNRYFAKIYWPTKYFVLQKFGERVPVPSDELRRLKTKTRKYLTDVRLANIRFVDGHFKVVDAHPRRPS